MAHPRPERDNFAGLAIIAALQSDPSGRTVHTGSNPLVPLLNGTFDMLRAARAADAAFKQWDTAYAEEKQAVEAAVTAKPLEEQREELLAKLKTVDDAIIAAAEAQKVADAPVVAVTGAAAIVEPPDTIL